MKEELMTVENTLYLEKKTIELLTTRYIQYDKVKRLFIVYIWN